MAYLFFRSEVIDNVEELANFFGSLSLNHVGNGFAANIPVISRSETNYEDINLMITHKSDLISR